MSFVCVVWVQKAQVAGRLVAVATVLFLMIHQNLKPRFYCSLIPRYKKHPLTPVSNSRCSDCVRDGWERSCGMEQSYCFIKLYLLLLEQGTSNG